MSPAFRVEWNQIAGWELVPQFNASYRLDHMQLRGSVGRTIRDADFTERYNNYQKLWVTGGRVGNPDLEAEKSISYEAGADYFAGKSVKISGTFFSTLPSRPDRLCTHFICRYAQAIQFISNRKFCIGEKYFKSHDHRCRS